MPGVLDELNALTPKKQPNVLDELAALPTERQVNQGLDAPTYLAQRADRGIADVLGAPVDLATMAINAGLAGADLVAWPFGGSVDARVKNPVLGSDWIADNVAHLFESAGGNVVAPEDVSKGVRYAGEAARYGTAAAVPSAGLAAKGTQIAGKMAPGMGRTLVEGMSAPYAGNAGKQFAGDVAAGAGAGTTMQAYDDYVPDWLKEKLGPLGSIIAAVVGAVGGSTASNVVASGGKAAVDTGRSILRGADPDAPVNPATGRPHSSADMDMAAQIAQRQATAPAQAADNIDVNRRAAADATYATSQMPTTALLADDIGMSMAENTARARNPQRFAEADAARRARASDLVDASAPRGSEGRNFTAKATDLYDETLGRARRNLDDAKTRQTQAADDIARQNADLAEYRTRQPEASERLSAEYEQQRLASQTEKNRLYNAVPDDTPAVGGDQVVAALDEADRGVPRAARTGDYADFRSRIRDLVQEVDPQTGEASTRDLTYGDLKVLRAEVSAARKEAVAAGRDVTYPDRIGTFLSDKIDETNPEAAKFYREEYAPRFKTGRAGEYTAARKRAARTGEESSATRPGEFGDKFLRKPEDAAALQRAIDVNGNPVTRDNARQWMLGDLAKSNVLSADKADVRYDRFRQWAERNRKVIDQFPEIRKEIDAELQKAADGGRLSRQLAMEVADAQTNLDDTERGLRRSALQSAIGNDPENAVASIMGSGDAERRMGEMIGRLKGDSDALDGLKAATRDWIKSKTATTGRNVGDPDSAKMSRANLSKLFSKHEKTLAQLYTPDEMNALRQAHRLLDAESALDVRATGGSNTYDKFMADRAQGVTGRKRMLEAALKAKFGVLKGGGIFRTVNLFLESLPNKPDAIGDILFEMHFNPELAKHLLTRPVKEIGTEAYNRKLMRLLAVAAGGRESGRGNGDENLQ